MIHAVSEETGRSAKTQALVRLSNRDITEILTRIRKSSDAKPIARQFAIWLIQRSDNLSRRIRVVIPAAYGQIGQDISYGVHDMASTGYNTNLDELFDSLGSANCIGSCAPEDEDSMVWLSPVYGDPEAEELAFDLASVREITI